MAGTRTANGANITYRFEWTGTNLDTIADAAARQVWAQNNPDRPIAEYDALTIPQRVAILDTFIANHLVSLASHWKRTTDMEAARVAAETYARSNYGLG